MKIELEVKIGDSQGGWKDGMVIAAKPLGVTWSLAQIRDFLDNEAPLPGFDQLSLERQEALVRRLRQVKWLLQPGRTIGDLLEKRPNLTQEQCQQYLDEAKSFLDRVRDHGLDINYGWEERKKFGVIIVDVPYEVIDDILGEGTDMTAHPFEERRRIGRRRYRIPYWNLLSQDMVTKFRDPDHTLVVNRNTTPLTLQGLLELAR